MVKKHKRALPDVSEADVLPTEHSSVLTRHPTLIDELKQTADKLGRDGATRGDLKILCRAMKDLRDTYASQLLTAGVQLGYVSHQLGHADVATTSRHYARWCGGVEYRESIRPGRGELPADLLARISVMSRQGASDRTTVDEHVTYGIGVVP